MPSYKNTSKNITIHSALNSIVAIARFNCDFGACVPNRIVIRACIDRNRIAISVVNGIRTFAAIDCHAVAVVND